MKKTTLLALMMVFALSLFSAMSIQAQTPTVLQFGERLPNLYYWDTNWIDSKVAMHPGSYLEFGMTQPMTPGDAFWGRPCVTDVPMKAIGIAAPVSINKDPAIDTDLTHRFPEYFQLYQLENTDKDNDTMIDGLYLLAEERWDTLTPQYLMTIPFTFFPGDEDSLFKLYEVYFSEPVYIHDTFVVGGTTHNNFRHAYDPEIDPLEYKYMLDHPATEYPHIKIHYTESNYIDFAPDPSFVVVRYFRPKAGIFGGLIVKDTSIFYKYTLGTNGLSANYWLPFFVIFDTNYVPGVGTYDDSCMAPTGLYIEEQNHWGTTLSWDAGGDTLWQLLVTPQGTPIEEGAPLWTPVNYKTLTDLDTGQWYVARVRTFCDTDIFGPWSDSLLFYVAGDECSMPFGLHVAASDSASVTLAWNNADVLLWEVELGLDDLGMSNAQTTTVTTNTLQVDGLYPDMWYWARVRALCDTDWYSDWTDTIQFHVPSQLVDTANAINPVEQYTYLMPNPAREEVTVMSSFKVRSVELYASDGKLLKEQEVNGLGTRLSLEGLPAGVYFVRVRTTAGVTTKRLVVE